MDLPMIVDLSVRQRAHQTRILDRDGMAAYQGISCVLRGAHSSQDSCTTARTESTFQLYQGPRRQLVHHGRLMTYPSH